MQYASPEYNDFASAGKFDYPRLWRSVGMCDYPDISRAE